MRDVSPDVLEWRKRTGADRRDEVWGGVLHMVPIPDPEQERLEGRLQHWLRSHWARPSGRDVLLRPRVSWPAIANWKLDFRVPHLALVTAVTSDRGHDEYFAGGPDVVIEIRSPRDETYEKLDFYAAVGCREIWVIDRDSRASEIYAARHGEPIRRAMNDAGGLQSVLGIELRTEDRRLALVLSGDDATRGLVP